MESLEVRDSRFCYWIISSREFPSPDNALHPPVPLLLQAKRHSPFLPPFLTNSDRPSRWKKLEYKFIGLERGDNLLLRGSMNFSSRSEIRDLFFFSRGEVLLENYHYLYYLSLVKNKNRPNAGEKTVNSTKLQKVEILLISIRKFRWRNI